MNKLQRKKSSKYLFNFKNEIETTCLLFTADWCDACKCIEPLFNKKMNQHKSNINFKKINIDYEDTDYTTIQYKIVKIPTIILIENDKIINYINEQITEDKLDEAIALLKPLEAGTESGGSTLSDTLRETWNRNRLTYERLINLVDDQRWWEALDSLNRLDHPWWQKRSESQRRIVESAITKRGSQEEHQQHGSGGPDVIRGEELEREVQVELQAGIDPWDAFATACRRLGGEIVEDGPESFCRRDRGSGP